MTRQDAARPTTSAPQQRTSSSPTPLPPLPELRLTALLAFTVLADELHFGRAATRLFLTPSGLSRQITTIERAIGAPLLHRSSRHVTLTAHGHALLPHAHTLLRTAQQALAAVGVLAPLRP